MTCFEAFGSEKGHYIAPSNSREFARRLAEVRFHAPIHPARFIAPKSDEIPEYLTLIQGGVCFQRSLSLRFAALNLVEIFHGDKSNKLSFGERPLTSISLRAEWGLPLNTPIILSGVAKDPDLERIWSNHRVKGLARKIADLDVVAVTAPNFTFWRNAPRLENLCNRRRMFRFAEALAAEGVAVIPHLNSTNDHDWQWMRDFYRFHPELETVCMEFRTGNRRKEIKQRKINALRHFRDELGRDIHPFIIGNIEAAAQVRKYFSKVTAIDSTPALKTVKRQKAVLKNEKIATWRKQPVASRACMADLFEANYLYHQDYVMRKMQTALGIEEGTVAPERHRRILKGSSQLVQGELPLGAA